ncbi:hypothetical protein D3C87_358560 [compost metagenome]
MEVESKQMAQLPPAPAPDTVSTLQQDIQRKLGRCMLRLQQYEKMVKVLAANFEIEGPAAQLQDIRKKREAALANQTLGGLVTALSSSYLCTRPADGEAEVETEWEPPDDRQIWLRMQMRISLTPEDHGQLVSGLRELVALRNRLVHHFIDMFDLGLMQGCLAAGTFLDSSYAQIDLHCTQAQEWLRTMDESRRRLASFMASDAWSDWLLHGIQPDGIVDWKQSSMVEHLLEAEAALAVDGWAPLRQAVHRMQTLHPEYTLERYGRTSWRQVLNDCGHFEHRCTEGKEPKDDRTWFRSRKRKAG